MYSSVSNSPSNFDSAYGHLLEIYNGKNIYLADKFAKLIIKTFPNEPTLINLIGLIKYDLGDLDNAISAYKKALKLSPNNSTYLNNLGNAYAANFEHKLALKYYNKTLNNTNNPADTWNNIGILYKELGKYKIAEEFFKKSVKHDPNNELYMNNRALNLIKCGNNNLARNIFEKLIKTPNISLKSYINASTFYIQVCDFNNAVNICKLAIERGINSSDLFSNYGIALYHLSQFITAEKLFQKSLSINPQNINTLKNLSVLKKTQGDLTEYKRILSQIIEIDPDNSDVKFMAAAINNISVEQPPIDYVKRHFDNISFDFDNLLMNKLSYKIPSILDALLSVQRPLFSSDNKILELGAGTGICGEVLKRYFSDITGVDISSNMINIAKQKNIYKKLHNEEIIEYLSNCKIRFDQIFCFDTLIYLGNLSYFYKMLSRRLTKQSYFTCNIELLNTDNKEYQLLPTERFAHNPYYLKAVAEQNGLTTVRVDYVTIRKERGKLIPGVLFQQKKRDTHR